jgi:DNA repair exonuclease SbcCD ATPase subunit
MEHAEPVSREGIMADENLRDGADPVLDGALDRFERIESELEETEERRRKLTEKAARAASELESVLNESIGKAIATRDRLEDELAVVVDHISRLEAVRARSSRTTTPDAVEVHRDPTNPGVEPGGEAYEEQWHELMKSRDGDSTFTSFTS